MYVIITGGDDYEPGPFSVTIPAGEISVPFNISIIDDNIFEGNESFTLTIDSSSLPSRFLLQPDCLLTVTITDDDGGKLKIYVHTYVFMKTIMLVYKL